MESEISLNKGEEIKWKGEPDSKSIFGKVIGGVVSGLFLSIFVSGFISVTASVILGAIAAVGVIIFISVVSSLLGYIKVKNTNYVVTNNRVIRKYDGITSTDYDDVSIDKIQNTGWNQGMIQSFFDLGNVSISTAGSGGTDLKFSSVENPEKIRNNIEKLSEMKKDKNADETKKGSDGGNELTKQVRRLNRNVEKLIEIAGDDNE